jgi:GntR family transcriptional regulator, transcriptional repressor for pyruvate dehydrogenase complex
VSRDAAAALAVAHIQDFIRHGEVRAGDRLPSERELARILGVSRSTLREAIRALIVMNVLVSRHGDGTYVSSLEPDLLSAPMTFAFDTRPALAGHLFEARRILEDACARLAAERIDDEELEKLEGLAETRDAGVDELIDSDLALHTAIAHATQNPILLALMGSIGKLTLDSRRATATLPGQAARTRRDHRAIVDALRRHDPDAAAEAMDAHLRSVERALRRHEKAAARDCARSPRA